MGNTKIDPVPIFLSDESGISMLKFMLSRKRKQAAFLQKKIESYLKSDFYPEVNTEIRPYFLEKVAELKYGNELKQVEKEIRNINFQLYRATRKNDKESDWQKAYEHATEDVKIVDIVGDILGVREFNRNIPCPFHEDKSPSLKIYENRNCFVCFGCDARGSPIDFVMKHKNCDFKEAVEFLSNF